MNNILSNETFLMLETLPTFAIIGWTLVIISGIVVVGHIISLICDLLRKRTNNQ